MDKYYSKFERTVNTIAELLGNLGGLYEISLIFGQLAIGIFSERLFIASILHKIYQIDQDRDDNFKHDVKRPKPPKVPKGEIPPKKKRDENNRDKVVDSVVKVLEKVGNLKKEEKTPETKI